MLAYLDLMLVAHIGLTIMSLSFVNEVGNVHIKKRTYSKIVVITLPLIFLIYANVLVSAFVIALTYIFVFFILFKKKFVEPLLQFIVAYYFLSFMMTVFSSSVQLRNGIVVITHPYGLFSFIVLPLFYLCFLLISKLVDNVYHLRNYVINAIVKVDGIKAKFRCYFDTGNTLRYEGIPVIFCQRLSYPFEEKKSDKKVLYETIAGERVSLLQMGMICFKKGAYQMVYIALVDSEMNFNGCECLLNAYLGR